MVVGESSQIERAVAHVFMGYCHLSLDQLVRETLVRLPKDTSPILVVRLINDMVREGHLQLHAWKGRPVIDWVPQTARRGMVERRELSLPPGDLTLRVLSERSDEIKRGVG